MRIDLTTFRDWLFAWQREEITMSRLLELVNKGGEMNGLPEKKESCRTDELVDSQEAYSWGWNDLHDIASKLLAEKEADNLKDQNTILELDKEIAGMKELNSHKFEEISRLREALEKIEVDCLRGTLNEKVTLHIARTALKEGKE